MYLRPRTLREAVVALESPGIRVLAGGTDVFPGLGERELLGPVLDVTAIDELHTIDVGPELVRIGGGVSWTRLIQAPLPRSFDALKAAGREVGSIQIQNRATVVGNLCNASPAADGVPPLLILDAEIELTSARGVRRVPLASFITGNRRTLRGPDEIASAVLVTRGMEAPSAFLKLGARRYLVISIAMVAAMVALDADGRIEAARIAVGSCSPVAARLAELERALAGVSVDGIDEAVEARYLDVLSPIDDLRGTAEYRRDAARTLVARALRAAAGGIS